MRLFINTANRYFKKITIFDSREGQIVEAEGQADVVELIDRALQKGNLKAWDLGKVSAELQGESRVGINIGAAAANALNYALGLKKVKELSFPADSEDEFR